MEIAGMPKEQVAGLPRAGLAEVALYTWKAKHGGMEISEAKLLLAI
jgi:hypothetical protein